jgi:putative addiction module component (TIGR02574 family)
MSAAEILQQARELPPEEQREIAETLLEELEQGELELTPEQIAELDRRAERALAHPERCRPLDDVVAGIEKRFRAKG